MRFSNSQCSDGTRHYPFGGGINTSDKDLTEKLCIDASHVFPLPISPHTSSANENGTPLCLSRPSEAESELIVFANLASDVGKQLFSMQYGISLLDNGDNDDEEVIATFDDDGSDPEEAFPVKSAVLIANNDKHSFTVRLFSKSGATQKLLDGDILRLVHPKTGRRLDQMDDSNDKTFQAMTNKKGKGGCGGGSHSTSSSRQLFPVNIERKGNYGYSVEWADGSTIIYSMSSIVGASGGKLKGKRSSR